MVLDGIVEIKNASIAYDITPILSGVEFLVNKGEFVYLIGKTASGKSSLMKLLYGEIPLISGEATVAGYQLSKLKRKQIPYLRRKVSVVFQDFQLLIDRTVHSNLQFVLKATGWKKKNEIDERIKEVLEKVDLFNVSDKMPHQLSGGEQQRVAIARSLLNDPDVILADEPTGNLDPETSETIMEILMRISESGRAVIMATHNYNLLKKYPAKTYKCEDGLVSLIEKDDSVIDFDSLLE